MKLSPRELQIVTCLQQGQTNKQIGQVLGLSQHTVRDAISPMLARFEVASRTALVAALAGSTSSSSANTPMAAQALGHRASDRRARGERRAQARHKPQH